MQAALGELVNSAKEGLLALSAAIVRRRNAGRTRDSSAKTSGHALFYALQLACCVSDLRLDLIPVGTSKSGGGGRETAGERSAHYAIPTSSVSSTVEKLSTLDHDARRGRETRGEG